VIDGISHADELLALGLEDVLDGDVALAFVALMQHSACHGALVDVPPSLREFVAGRMVEPVHEVDEALEIVRANVAKLRSMHTLSRRDDLLAQLDAAVASGDDKTMMRVMKELDALGRR
jgi:Fe-S oxidoreductase